MLSSLNRISILLAGAILLSMALCVPVEGQDEDRDPAATAVELFEKAQDAHEKGELAKAIELYEKAIAAVAEFPEAEFQRGNALLAAGRRDEAEKAFRKAIELRPQWSLPLASLGSLLVGRKAYPEAEKLLTEAITQDAQNALAYSALTELKLNTKAKPSELKDLLAKLTIFASRGKPAASTLTARAAVELALGDKAAARISVDKALAIEPTNRFALIAKAGLMLDEGDTSGADGIITALERSTPNAEQVVLLRARFLHFTDRSEQALAALSSIAAPSPEAIALRERIAVTRSDNAAALEKQLESNPADAGILGRLCSLYRTSDPAKALAFCRRAFEAEPQNVSHAIGFAAALVQAKAFVEAIELLRRIQAIAPENVTVRANLATALFQLKQYPEAKKEYEWIIEKQPGSPAAYFFLAIVHDQMAEYMDAMANYQLFLKYADADRNKLEIEKVNLRLPILQRQIKDKKGKTK